MRPKSGQKVDKLAREDFLGYLRDALNHLYDADHLRHSPLATLFGLADRFDAAPALRNILTGAITDLKPAAGAPAQQRAWRIYDALFCCYVQQLNQQVVADQLAISTRQLRRELHAAIEALAEYVWTKYQLQSALPNGPARQTVDSDLAWLKGEAAKEPSDPNDAIAISLDLAQPLAEQHQVQLRLEAAQRLPQLSVHPVALDQMLLNLLTLAIPRAACGEVEVSARAMERAVEIVVRAKKECNLPLSRDDAANLDLTQQLADLSSGQLIIEETGGEREEQFSATLRLPALERLPVLVVDDNTDFLQLLHRFAAGTRYRVVGTQDPEKALKLAEELSPHAILLDVMMPQLDGWKVLGRLRHHPATQHTPIIVCTILPQEKLALSLGASGFLKKPVTRQSFLAALEFESEGEPQETALR
jgi:CheY-like chemotaxis protein